LFYDVQELIESNSKRSGNTGGRTGKASNLFQHIVKCGLCGEVMWYENKGPGSKGGKKLTCSTTIKKPPGKQCKAKSISYDEFEKLFLDKVKKLDISEIIPEQDITDDKLIKIRQDISTSRGRVKEMDEHIKNIQEAIPLTSVEKIQRTLMKKYEDIEEQKSLYQKSYLALLAKEKKLINERDDIRKNIDQTNEVYELLN